MRISDYCAKTDAYYCSPALPGDDGNYLISDPLNTYWRKIKIGPAEEYGQLFNYRTGQLMRDAYPEEQAASLAASRVDGGRGVITVGGSAATCFSHGMNVFISSTYLDLVEHQQNLVEHQQKRWTQ
jgi:hypothetical protein